jgi:hypothetical protein
VLPYLKNTLTSSRAFRGAPCAPALPHKVWSFGVTNHTPFTNNTAPKTPKDLTRQRQVFRYPPSSAVTVTGGAPCYLILKTRSPVRVLAWVPPALQPCRITCGVLGLQTTRRVQTIPPPPQNSQRLDASAASLPLPPYRCLYGYWGGTMLPYLKNTLTGSRACLGAPSAPALPNKCGVLGLRTPRRLQTIPPPTLPKT